MSERRRGLFRFRRDNIPANPRPQSSLEQMREVFGGEERPIRDMDSELLEKGQSINALKAEGESRLLEERTKEDALAGHSEEELSQMDENIQNLFDRLTPLIADYEDFFERRAMALHATGGAKHIGLPFLRKYEVNDFAKDEESGKKYRYRFRYHIEGHGDDKRYVPDRYEQILFESANDATIKTYEKEVGSYNPWLRVEFDNGRIRSVDTKYYRGQSEKFEQFNTRRITRLVYGGSLEGILSHLSGKDDHKLGPFGGPLGATPWTQASFIIDYEQREVALCGRFSRLINPNKHGSKKSERAYVFNALDNTFVADYVEDMGKKGVPDMPQVGVNKYADAFGEVFGLIPTRVLNEDRKKPQNFDHIT